MGSVLHPDLHKRLREFIEGEIERGDVQGLQVFVGRHGRVVVDEGYGVTNTGEEVSAQTRFPIFSASKPVTATAIHILADRAALLYHDTVARYVPEFGVKMKDVITFHHALTNQAGIPDFYMRWVPPEAFAEWDRAIADICALPLEYYPGAQIAYHPMTIWGILAEVVQRIDGRSFVQFCADEIFGPLGMKRTTWGLPEALEPEATDVVPTTEDPENIYRRWATRTLKDAVLPGGGIYATASDLGRFYMAWCAGGTLDGVRILSPATVELATRRHTDAGMPGVKTGGGYGFGVGADIGRPLQRGTLASERSFGHGGAAVACAWADPANGLSVVMLCNLEVLQPDSERRFNVLADIVHRAVAGD